MVNEHYIQSDAAAIPLPSDSVDLVVTSPPYAMLRKHLYGGIPESDYIDWFMPIASEIARVLVPGGSLVLNINAGYSSLYPGKSTYVYELVIALCRAGWIWHDEYIWHKGHPYPCRFKYKFIDAHEPLYHLSRTSELATFNRDAVKVPRTGSPPNSIYRVKQNKSGNTYAVNTANSSFHTIDRYPTNVIAAHTVQNNNGHPAAFPPAIPRFFIALLTNEGDVVLDPFSGGGTAVRTANAMLRKGIGCDILHKYASLAHNRRARARALL